MDTLTAPDADLTVFAPNNGAFMEAVDKLGITADELLESDSLGEILKYHVVPGKRLSDSLQNGDALMVNDADVLYDDLEAENGVVHVINAVLLPPAPESVQKVADMELVEAA